MRRVSAASCERGELRAALAMSNDSPHGRPSWRGRVLTAGWRSALSKARVVSPRYFAPLNASSLATSLRTFARRL